MFVFLKAGAGLGVPWGAAEHIQGKMWDLGRGLKTGNTTQEQRGHRDQGTAEERAARPAAPLGHTWTSTAGCSSQSH